MSKTTKEAINAVRDYLQSTNRPYSSNDIFNNLQNKVSKANVVKALESLVQEEEIVERVNGKQKIYFARQDQVTTIDKEKLKQLNADIDENNKVIEQLKESISKKERQAKQIKDLVPIESLQEELKKLVEELATTKSKLDSLNNICKDFDQSKYDQTKDAHKKLHEQWKIRKRLAMNIVDMILENYPKSKKDFIEELCIEIDEDIGVTMPQF